MATPLGFSVWRDDDGFYPPGQTAELYDGELVSLVHKVKNYLADSGKDISEIDFKTTLEQNGNIVAEHSFNFDKMSSIWFVVDPSDSDENGSFTPVFINAFANCGAGDHNYAVKLYLNNELHHEGQLVYKSDGQNTAYKALLLKFGDVSGARGQATLEHQQEYAEQLEKEDAEQQAAREFNVYIENTDSGHTKYVVCTNQSSLSEDIHEVLPKQTLKLDLNRGTQYELKYYDQDSSKEYAYFIEMLDESFHDAKYKIN
jgi:hypothetical protein